MIRMLTHYPPHFFSTLVSCWKLSSQTNPNQFYQVSSPDLSSAREGLQSIIQSDWILFYVFLAATRFSQIGDNISDVKTLCLSKNVPKMLLFHSN